ncbi:MAG: peptidase M24 [Deltaproteobacteria bacterium]|nr:peptidoglycan DD-metalloendopeptidase family protein [Deltaproteobacteria bacterium]RLB32859.1 MAG: peptidase M24 [Deltaproteobacteria bacterium]
MAAKKITILFLPQGTKKVKQLSIARWLLVLAFFLLLSACFTLAWIVKDYKEIRAKVPRLASLEKQNRHQKEQLVSLARKIEGISRKMAELKAFDKKLRTMVNLEKPDENQQIAGVGGSDDTIMAPKYSIEKAHEKLVRLMYQSLDDLDKEIYSETREKEELLKYLKTRESMLLCTPSIWPVRGWVSSGFGYRISPFTNEKEFHKGIDICSRMRATIVAPADGVVASVGWDFGYGRTVLIHHGYGLDTKYAHLAKILVKKGQVVKRGQKIGLVGNSGRSTGPHLHYEVHLNGVPVNPFHYILN